MNFQVNCRGLESQLGVEFLTSSVKVRWQLTQLGKPFPGGNWLVKDPILTFEREGHEAISLYLLNEPPYRATICGLRAFRRMRGAEMPKNAMSYALGLPAGEYQLRFSAELFDCRRLVHFCDAIQFFAGDFDDLLRQFQSQVDYWAALRHAEAAEPFHWPCDLVLGELTVPEGKTEPPKYHVTNEADLSDVAWEPAFPLSEQPVSGTPLQPENFLSRQLKSGLHSARENRFCRWGTHCSEEMVAGGNVGTGLRPFAMWGNSFSLHYALTGDEESGAGAHFCANTIRGFIEQGAAPKSQHVLPFGIATMTLLRYARATNRPDLLEFPARIWREWPYDWNRHNPATQPDDLGGDMTPNDTYNMKLVGAGAMWLTGKLLGDCDLMEKGRDCVLNFVLPALQDEGFWFYRPGSPEGAIVNGLQSHNHYDGFVKQMIGRLLLYPEWREETGVLEALRRGMDFSLKHLSEDNGRVLKWELHPGAKYGPRETLARTLGHAGMFCEPLYVLSRFVDATYLEPLQKSLQAVYDARDEPILADYWDNSWFYSVYAGLFSLSWLGVKFEGRADQLCLRLGEGRKGHLL